MLLVALLRHHGVPLTLEAGRGSARHIAFGCGVFRDDCASQRDLPLRGSSLALSVKRLHLGYIYELTLALGTAAAFLTVPFLTFTGASYPSESLSFAPEYG
jgi:hypothetical protein